MKKGQSVDRVPFYVAGAFAAALIILQPLGAFNPLDNKWVDQMFRWRGMQPADARIIVVAIDDDSIRAIGQYPWPRRVYSTLLDRLFADGAKVVGLDILFVDPSRPEEDAILVEATKKWGKRVVHSIDMGLETKTHYTFRSPFPDLAAAAKSEGVVNQIAIDADDFIRQTYLMYGASLDPRDWTKDAERKPSLGVQILSVYQGRLADEYVRDRNLLYLNARGQQNREFYIPGPHGEKILASEPIYGIRRISAIKILRDNLKPEERQAVKGGIVLVGSTAVGTVDHHPNPFTHEAPGVEVHATVIDNILNHRELQHVHGWTTVLIAFIFAFLSAWLLRLVPLLSTAVALAILMAWIGGNLFAFHRYWLLQFTAPTLALTGPFLILLVRRTLLEHNEKRFIKKTFGHFVAPEVVENLIKEPGRVKLGGEKREMSVMFLDIAHFTSISEQMDPETLIHFLNEYLSALSGVIFKHMGVVDKYIGDCIMAFWNAPLEQKDHKRLACLTAIECQEVMQDLNRRLAPPSNLRPEIRIGVNSGTMTVGLTGSQQKMQYTVIGDEVNLASRLEGANKFFGSRILVSQACCEGAKDAVEARELGRIRVVGKAVPIKVYELLGRKGQLPGKWPQALPSYRDALRAFGAHDFAKAKAQFAAVLHLVPGDKASRHYLNMLDGASSSAAKDWDGVFNLAEK